jgi:MFS family permease
VTPIARLRAGGLSLDRFGWSALRHRPFQVFFLAMFASNAGGFIYVAALGWYVLGLTGSAAAVGLAYAANGLPQLLLTMHAGVFTDRLGARLMLAVGIGVAGLSMFAIALVTLVPAAPLELVLVAAALCGAGYTIGGPGSMSIVSELVPPDAMSSSVALNWLLMSVARIAGGLLGGLLLAISSSGVAFVVAGLLNALPALALITLKVRPGAATRLAVPASALLRPILEAFGYARRFPTLGVIVLLAAAPGAVGLSYIFLLPVAARELGIGADGLGTLIAASGLGGLVAGLGLESLQRRFGHGRAVAAGLAIASAALVGFGLAPGSVAAIVLLCLVGGGFAMYAAATSTLIQALTPARLRGRMIGLFATLYWGLLPVGSIIGGQIAQLSSGRTAVLVTGILLGLIGVAAFVCRPQILTLKVRRDGLSVTGNLDGTGAQPPQPGEDAGG